MPVSLGYGTFRPSFAEDTHHKVLATIGCSSYLSERDIARVIYSNDPPTAIKIICAGLHALAHERRTAGSPIDDCPDILATLCNLGYEKSVPKRDPISGGSTYPTIINGELITNMVFVERVKKAIDECHLLRSAMGEGSPVEM